MNLSRQTRAVYKILTDENKPLAVTAIAFKMRIAPADVYRLVKPLIEMGLVDKSLSYPVTLTVKEHGSSLGLFLLEQSKWFNENFNFKSQLSGSNDLDMKLAFVQGREELMNNSAKEIDQAIKSVDLLRSGHEMPPEVMRALAQAIKRKVKVRMLIQDYGEENKDQVQNWIRNGILVKRIDLKHLRLMLYDSRTCYFMSYKHADSNQDVGMRIVYPPFAAILSQYFDQLWLRSEMIS